MYWLKYQCVLILLTFVADSFLICDELDSILSGNNNQVDVIDVLHSKFRILNTAIPYSE